MPDTMRREPSATRGRANLLTMLGVAGVVFLADQVTKALVVAAVPVGGKVRVIGDLVQVWHAQNSGAAFSLFEGGFLLFVAVTMVALAMIVYFHRSFAGRSRWLQVILGVVLGGTLGNFSDRVRFGYVTDWISVGIGNTRWPTFNIADSGVVVGIILLVAVLTFFTDQQQQGHAPT
jgi:signal peptidase II